MDIRDLAKGSELYLPVEVKGALFSLGDTHAAQGDGEVCGTAIESQLDVTVKLELVKNANLMQANAIVMMRFDSAEIGQTMSEIVAYGTAVVLEKAL